MLEAHITLIDRCDPDRGYRIEIVRNGCIVLASRADPATGKDLASYEQCLDVLELYRKRSN